MATTADIKNGSIILHKNSRMKVVEFQHVKPGKGPAFVRTKLKDIKTGKIIDETFNSGVKLDFIRVTSKNFQYLFYPMNLSQLTIHLYMDGNELNLNNQVVFLKNKHQKEIIQS